jgi:hypothetical protein
VNILQLVLISLFILSASVSYLSLSIGNYVLKIINHWLRWITLSVMFALLIEYFTEPGIRPQWLLITTGFLLYAIFETIFYWIQINAISYGDISLFPKFKLNTDGDEWPSNKKYIHVKDWLRDNNFTHQQSLKANIREDIYIRSSIYEEEESNIRCQILFIPQRDATLSMCYIFSSCTKSEKRYITDNVFIPYGGYYPENWHIVRKPKINTITGVFNIHKKRLKNSVETIVEWNNEPLEDINQQQRLLESTNLDTGFLYPSNMHEEHGKISNEGRYRMWKEIWLMNYLGITVKA